MEERQSPFLVPCTCIKKLYQAAADSSPCILDALDHGLVDDAYCHEQTRRPSLLNPITKDDTNVDTGRDVYVEIIRGEL